MRSLQPLYDIFVASNGEELEAGAAILLGCLDADGAKGFPAALGIDAEWIPSDLVESMQGASLAPAVVVLGCRLYC